MQTALPLPEPPPPDRCTACGARLFPEFGQRRCDWCGKRVR